MDGMNVMLLSVAQQRIYVDAIFAMAALDGFELVGAGGDSNDTPVICARQAGEYTIEISWMDEDELGPDATKAVWQVQVIEPGTGGSVEWKSHMVYVALHASDALRIAKGLVRFHRALTRPSEGELWQCSLAR